VIYSIERCICHVPDACRDCGYDNEPCPKCFEHLLRDALSLLKAQEARVMTVEDAKQAEAGTVVWLEWRIESKINSAIFFRLINKGIDDSLEFHVLDGFVAARLACYGTEWRCWTSRPTDEQREATLWDELPKEET
jgi:hypothetical protein